MIILMVVLAFALFAYVPLALVITQRRRPVKMRPVNEVLSEAFAQGQITRERFEGLMDEVHASMPTLDAPYPKVKDHIYS